VPRWYRGKFDPTPLAPYKYHPKGINHEGIGFLKPRTRNRVFWRREKDLKETGTDRRF
jgi:hypothetical protein